MDIGYCVVRIMKKYIGMAAAAAAVVKKAD